MLRDSFGRTITYLRISVTDRCNLHCVYCIPPGEEVFKDSSVILSYEEIAEVVRVAASQGVREVRLTGGEPLLRKDLPVLVKMLADIPGIDDLSLTTNGLLLDKLAEPLAKAGLRRVNVSVDTLDPFKYHRITRGGSLEKVWAGIQAAEAAGLWPVKINNVVLRGINDDELLDMARLSLDHPWHVRFIEVMPVRNQPSWGDDFPTPDQTYISIDEMLQRMETLSLEEVHREVGSGPAREYHLRGAMGRIGFITPVSHQFCSECNRMRLTADGHLRPCLLSDRAIPLMETLRAGKSILPLLEEALALKPEGHRICGDTVNTWRCMRQIGG